MATKVADSPYAIRCLVAQYVVILAFNRPQNVAPLRKVSYRDVWHRVSDFCLYPLPGCMVAVSKAGGLGVRGVGLVRISIHRTVRITMCVNTGMRLKRAGCLLIRN